MEPNTKLCLWFICVVGLCQAARLGSILQLKPKKKSPKFIDNPPRSAVSECTYYNQMMSQGDGTCEQCTAVNYSLNRLESDLRNTIPVEDTRALGGTSASASARPPQPPQNGEFTDTYYQLKKQPGVALGGIYPFAEDKPRPCMWCPETQLCGSPTDEEIDKPCGSKKFSGTWINREMCTISGPYVQDAYDAQAHTRQDRIEGTTPAEVARMDIEAQHALTLPLTPNVGENVNEHALDTISECLGTCVERGPSHCDLQTLLLPPERDTGSYALLEQAERGGRQRQRRQQVAAGNGHNVLAARDSWGFDDDAGPAFDGPGEEYQSLRHDDFPINEPAWQEEQENAEMHRSVGGAASPQSEVAGDNVWAGAYPENGEEDHIMTRMHMNTVEGITTPVPCSFDLSGSAPFFMRAWGKYTLDRWLDCRLIQCEDSKTIERKQLWEDESQKKAEEAKQE